MILFSILYYLRTVCLCWLLAQWELLDIVFAYSSSAFYWTKQFHSKYQWGFYNGNLHEGTVITDYSCSERKKPSHLGPPMAHSSIIWSGIGHLNFYVSVSQVSFRLCIIFGFAKYSMAYRTYGIESYMSDPIYSNIFIHVLASCKEEDERKFELEDKSCTHIFRTLVLRKNFPFHLRFPLQPSISPTGYVAERASLYKTIIHKNSHPSLYFSLFFFNT